MEAEGGPWALQALYRALDEGKPFRVVVIDKEMPGMDGEATSRAIQADPRLADLRIVMLTSLGAQRTVSDLGLVGWVSKPVRRDDLFDVLFRTISGTMDGGSCFGPARGPARENSGTAASCNARILIAEDNFTNRKWPWNP